MTIEMRGSAIESGRVHTKEVGRRAKRVTFGGQAGDELWGVRIFDQDLSGTPPLSLIHREICGTEVGTLLALGVRRRRYDDGGWIEQGFALRKLGRGPRASRHPQRTVTAEVADGDDRTLPRP